MGIEERFERNIGALTREEQELLSSKKAAIIGCGGLGCYSAEFLARLGIGHLTLVDGDVFSASNLNRQLNALETSLGKSKASIAKERLSLINPGLSVKTAETFLTDENAQEILKGHDVIIDALDNVKTRLLIEKTASKLGIPLIHGAVEEWSAQVCTVFPGDFTLSMLYPEGASGPVQDNTNPKPVKISVLAFTPAFCASIQAAEAVKVLLGKENILRKKLLTASLKENTFDIIDLI